MLKKTIKYTDYDGNEREEDFYFNLSKAELVELRYLENGGMENLIQKIIKEQDNAKLMLMFKEIVLKSYGIKSLDGKSFEKSEEISRSFMNTEAYSELFMELMDPEKCAAFIEAIMPQDVMEEVKKQNATGNLTPVK